jgi:rhodanese-related sulfurtransferase
VHGHEISRNAASALAASGIEAYTLTGGIEGWREAGGPTVPKATP